MLFLKNLKSLNSIITQLEGELMFQYLKIALVSFNLLISIFPIVMYAEQVNPTKQEMWEAMSVEVGYWVDGVGYPIDKEIKDTVIALNLMGIETVASCGGHLDKDLSYPWVDIQVYPSEINKLIQEGIDIQEEIKIEEVSLKLKYPNLPYNDFYYISEGENLKNLRKKHWLIAVSMEEIQMKCLEPINQLLNQFYENRTTSYDKTLIIAKSSLARLRSIGIDRQYVRSSDQRLQSLKEYQEEMKDFTIFLKQKYLN